MATGLRRNRRLGALQKLILVSVLLSFVDDVVVVAVAVIWVENCRCDTAVVSVVCRWWCSSCCSRERKKLYISTSSSFIKNVPFTTRPARLLGLPDAIFVATMMLLLLFVRNELA